MFKSRLFFLLSLLFCPFLALAQAESLTPLQEEGVAKMDCPEASDQLEQRIQLQQQLGSSFLASNSALESVYQTFGKRLAEVKDPKEIQAISEHFLKNAKDLAANQNQNQKVIQNLNNETNWLMSRVQLCVEIASMGQAIPVGSINVYTVELEILGEPKAGQNVKAILVPDLDICSEYEAFSLKQTSSFQHSFSVRAKRTSCSKNSLQFRKSEAREIDLGKFEPGTHTIRYFVYSGHYVDLSFTVKR